ncbi:MAG: hypothetical protein MUC41_11995 [Syntrophobacteraceae bacterium]|jgi:ArsR family metal-binding transcriptional regulator|nr:hypothetical protein [Syntrophobacteraceae bacterium]
MKLNVVEILKHLPKTNCMECGDVTSQEMWALAERSQCRGADGPAKASGQQ